MESWGGVYFDLEGEDLPATGKGWGRGRKKKKPKALLSSRNKGKKKPLMCKVNER